MWTGEESKTWTFMIGAGYVSMATDYPELQKAIGSSTETLANIGSEGYGMAIYSFGSTSTLPRLTINTGKNGIRDIDCALFTLAGAEAVLMTSRGEAAALGVSEAASPAGGEFGQWLEARGFSATPDLMNVSAADAQAFMSATPNGTKFAILYAWSPNVPGHAVNRRVGTFGLSSSITRRRWGRSASTKPAPDTPGRRRLDRLQLDLVRRHQ
jgi:hypothetical protein